MGTPVRKVFSPSSSMITVPLEGVVAQSFAADGPFKEVLDHLGREAVGYVWNGF
jgi:hypothetical protein